MNKKNDVKTTLYTSDLKHISKNLAGFIKNKKQESLYAKNNRQNQKTNYN